MVCLGFEPGVALLKAQMNPLSYGGTHYALWLLNTTLESYLEAAIFQSVRFKRFTSVLKIATS